MKEEARTLFVYKMSVGYVTYNLTRLIAIASNMAFENIEK